MKKVITFLISIFLLCNFVFSQEKQTSESSTTTDYFSIGSTFSLLGIEVSAVKTYKNFEFSSGLVYDCNGLGSLFTGTQFTGYTKNDFGYVFPPTKKNFIYSAGLNVDLAFDYCFEEPPIFAFGAYGKVKKNFGKNMEIAYETYIPFWFSFLTDVSSFFDLLVSPLIGAVLPSISFRYVF